MRQSAEIVIVTHKDAVSRRITPIVGKLPPQNKCRYCICVLPNGACNQLDKAVIESGQVGLDCGEGRKVYRDINNDPRIVPYTSVGGVL